MSLALLIHGNGMFATSELSPKRVETPVIFLMSLSLLIFVVQNFLLLFQSRKLFGCYFHSFYDWLNIYIATYCDVSFGTMLDFLIMMPGPMNYF